MKYFRRIDEDCAIAAQLTPAQIQQLPNAGFHVHSHIKCRSF